MEDAPTGQVVRQDSPAGSDGTGASDTGAGGSDTAPLPAIEPEADLEPEANLEPEAGRRTGGRRYRAGPPAPQRRSSYEWLPARETPFPSRFGARGTLAGLLAWCLVSCLLAAWLHLVVLAGLGFCTGSALAAWYCRPTALLRLVTAVPAVFALAAILAQLATVQRGAHHRLVLPVIEGTLLTLAAVAPWLFGGTAGAITIALFRGLPRCIRDLRAELRGRAPAGRAPAGRGPAGRAPAGRAAQALRAPQGARPRDAAQARQAPRG